MTSSDETIDRVLDLARRGFSPEAPDRARVRQALAMRLATPDASPGPGSAEAALPPELGQSLGFLARLKATGLGGLLLASGLLGAGAGAGFFAGHRAMVTESVPRASAPPDVQQRAVAEAAPPPQVEVAGEDQAPPSERPAAVARPRAPGAAPQPDPTAPSTDAFEEELLLLRRAERALRAKNPQLTLGLLQELDQRFPHGSLLEERAAARVLSSCQLDPGAASAVGKRFVRSHPSSVYLSRIRSSCGLEGKE